MDFQTAIKTCMSKFGTFSGRASRSEFWWFYLALTMFGWASQVVGENSFHSAVMRQPELGRLLAIIYILSKSIFSVASCIAVFSTGSRRLHDIGKSGWWQLIALTGVGLILLIIWWAKPSDPDDNKYGYGPEATADVPRSPPVQQSTTLRAQPPQDDNSRYARPSQPATDTATPAPIQPIKAQQPANPFSTKPPGDAAADKAAKGFMEWANPANRKD
ncbi:MULTISPECIES: DUF805 domain-containing protein [unclassified Xanthobacter]|uniref:DUF805 domain-containing protein n=1 Tax=unclassified Xanthobacter TaxID=2623496 RepID=UPI001F309426|nr:MULTISPECIES: DUF805 domain-containing protein [unclassified Xanthobacter]